MGSASDAVFSSSHSASQLSWLTAAEAIRTEIYRYCAAIDRGQYDWLRAAFHEDATISVGGRETALTPFIEELRKRQEVVHRAVHMIGNVLIERLGPETAFVESYGLAFEQRAATARHGVLERTLRVRYADQFERREGEWKIARRLVILDHLTSMQLPEGGSESSPADGTRDADDPAQLMRLSLARSL